MSARTHAHTQLYSITTIRLCLINQKVLPWTFGGELQHLVVSHSPGDINDEPEILPRWILLLWDVTIFAFKIHSEFDSSNTLQSNTKGRSIQSMTFAAGFYCTWIDHSQSTLVCCTWCKSHSLRKTFQKHNTYTTAVASPKIRKSNGITLSSETASSLIEWYPQVSHCSPVSHYPVSPRRRWVPFWVWFHLRFLQVNLTRFPSPLSLCSLFRICGNNTSCVWLCWRAFSKSAGCKAFILSLWRTNYKK